MIGIKVQGLEKLQNALKQFPREIINAIGQAGNEAANRVVLPTEGLKRYPSSTSANLPPTPFYIRGKGTQLATRNLLNSERYGTQFYSRNEAMKTYIGNRASYAQYLTDEEKQSSVMARIGWRKLIDVAKEKLPEIQKIYQAWVSKTIRDLGL